MSKERDYFDMYWLEITLALEERGVLYKYIGGCTICLINEERNTLGIDVLIESNADNIERFIDALCDCKYADRALISTQIYGDHDETSAFRQLTSEKKEWLDEGYYINLGFSIGTHLYETMPAIRYEYKGVEMSLVDFTYIANMKATMSHQLRQQDIDDIEILNDYLGLDRRIEISKEPSFLIKVFRNLFNL